MKTCKKCKKNIPNNMKICKFCGTDVSKVKPNNKKIVKKDKLVKDVKPNLDEQKTEILETSIIENLKLDEKEELSSFNILEEEKKDKKTKELTKASKIYLVKKQMKVRKVTNLFVFVLIFLLASYFIFSFIHSFDDNSYKVKGNENINEVSFNIGDIINYKEIKYTVNSYKLSTGTAYKKPKAGNRYIIVGLSLENNSDKKYHYSGTYFTMLNEKGEEVNRIISPVNAGEDLYSGNLVVGGKKDGSLVFEVPAKDKELYLQYYDQEELDTYLELLKEEEDKEKDKEEKKEKDKKEEQEEKKEIKKPTPKFRVKINIKTD